MDSCRRYNAQAAVEPDFQLIVGQTVTQAANDKEQLLPMVDVVEQQSGQRPEEVLADSGYCSEKNLEQLESAGESRATHQRIHRHANGRSMANIANLVRAVRCRRERREWIA